MKKMYLSPYYLFYEQMRQNVHIKQAQANLQKFISSKDSLVSGSVSFVQMPDIETQNAFAAQPLQGKPQVPQSSVTPNKVPSTSNLMIST